MNKKSNDPHAQQRAAISARWAKPGARERQSKKMKALYRRQRTAARKEGGR
jgi:hypothetical protein